MGVKLCVVCDGVLEGELSKCPSCGLSFSDLNQIAEIALGVCERLSNGETAKENLVMEAQRALIAASWIID